MEKSNSISNTKAIVWDVTIPFDPTCNFSEGLDTLDFSFNGNLIKEKKNRDFTEKFLKNAILNSNCGNNLYIQYFPNLGRLVDDWSSW